MEGLFSKPVKCREYQKVKLNKHPGFLNRENFIDEYSLSVGSTYHIDKVHYCRVIGTPIGNVDMQLVTLREFPDELFLRSGFSE